MKSIFLLGLYLTLITGAWATPLNRAQLPEDTLWLAHLDLPQLKSTEVGQFILESMQGPVEEKRFAGFKAIFRFDLRYDVDAITLYGFTGQAGDGVVLLQGNFDTDHLETLVQAGDKHRSETHRGYTIHNWVDEDKISEDNPEPRTSGAVHTTGLVIISKEMSDVAVALDVLDNVRPSLAGTDRLELPSETINNSYLLGAGRYTEIAKIDPKAEFLRSSEILGFALGETAGVVEGVLETKATTENDAQLIEAIAGGLAALLILQATDPGAQALSDAVEVQREGRVVTISASLPTAVVIQMIKDDQVEKASE